MFNFGGVPHLIGFLKPPNGKNINAHRNLEMLPRMLQRKWDKKPSRPTLPTQNLFFGKSRITPKMRPGGLLPFRIAHRCLRPTIHCQKHHRCPSGAARLCESRGTSTMWKNGGAKIEFVSLGSGLMWPHLHGVKPLDTGRKYVQKVVRVSANQSSTKHDSTA